MLLGGVDVTIHHPLGHLSKPLDEFRNYETSSRQNTVEQHYKDMRSFQTVDFVKKMHEKYSFKTGFQPRAIMSVREAFRCLESYVDASDPDLRYRVDGGRPLTCPILSINKSVFVNLFNVCTQSSESNPYATNG